MSNMKEPKPFVSLDADHQGTLLCLCADLHSAWAADPQIYFEGATTQDIIYQSYLLGNIEGRLLDGSVYQEDIDRLERWEEEMKEHKQ